MIHLDGTTTQLHPWPNSGPAWATISLLGPPLPSRWPRPSRRILIYADNGDTAVKPGRPSGAGPNKLAIQVATRWG